MTAHSEKQIEGAFSSLLQLVKKCNHQGKCQKHELFVANGDTFRVFFLPYADDKMTDLISDEMRRRAQKEIK